MVGKGLKKYHEEGKKGTKLCDCVASGKKAQNVVGQFSHKKIWHIWRKNDKKNMPQVKTFCRLTSIEIENTEYSRIKNMMGSWNYTVASCQVKSGPFCLNTTITL